MVKNIVDILNKIDDVIYYPILIIVMAVAGLYFTIRTKGVQIRLLGEALNVIREKPDDKNQVSSLQAMLVSTASQPLRHSLKARLLKSTKDAKTMELATVDLPTTSKRLSTLRGYQLFSASNSFSCKILTI